MKKDPWHRNHLIRDGILAAIHAEMKANPNVYILGEGAHMKVHFDAPQIEKEFPDRVLTLPIAEDGNSNFAVGMALAGLVPIVDVISSDFLYRTMDAICNTMAKMETVGEPRTMIVRSEFLTGGPTSGQRIEALFAHIPGLRVAVPSNPSDAFSLMQEALATKAVTVFFEDRMIEDASMPMPPKSGLPISADGPVIVSYGITQRIIEDNFGLGAYTLIDLRTLYPLAMDTILEHARRTRRLLIVEPDVTFLGIGAEIAAQVAERAPDVYVKRLGVPRATIPASRELHERTLPAVEEIRVALRVWP